MTTEEAKEILECRGNGYSEDEFNQAIEFAFNLIQMKKKAISGSVHHALNTHYIVIDQPQLNAILKEFDQDEKAKVIILHDNE